MSKRSRDVIFNKCDHCGRFIAYKDFHNGLAKTSHGYERDGSEYYETWHVVCQEKIRKESQ